MRFNIPSKEQYKSTSASNTVHNKAMLVPIVTHAAVEKGIEKKETINGRLNTNII